MQATQIQATSHHELYEQDFCLWIEQAANLLRAKNLTELDLENLIEEIESMGRSEKRSISSNLRVILMHLVKYKYQPEKRSNSWRYTIIEHRKRLEEDFKVSPSLRKYFLEELADIYLDARKFAAIEIGISIDTFPIASPFTVSQILDEDYLPE
jgi:predicted DNA-binding ribbon-helix-helix protein